MAMRAAGTHLGTVGRQPTHFQSLAHAHFRQKLLEAKVKNPSLLEIDRKARSI
jgi:hypothetical protein